MKNEPSSVDNDLDGIIDATENIAEQADAYTDQLATQLRKGFFGVLCVADLW